MKRKILKSTVSLLLIACALLSLWGCGGGVDFLKDDLSKYITISEEDYKNYTLNLSFDSVDNSDVEREIMKLICKNKNSKPEYNGGNVKNIPITVGDVAYIYYRGYTVDENGVETDLDQTSNLTGEMISLEIGSGTFIKGFEEALIGKNPKDYPQFELIKSGKVLPGDVIYLTYSVMLPDGRMYTREKERIDLSKSYVDSIYGKGFAAFLSNASVGSKIPSSQTFKMEDGDAIYYDMTVNYKTECEKNKLTLDIRFPMDYYDKDLRGKNAKFDVYVRYINIYNTPEYNDTFIKETLKLTEESLSEYEGASLTEKHRNYLLENLKKENSEKIKTLKEEAMWEYYHSKVRVKKLPKEQVENVFDEYYYELATAYKSYGTVYYDSLSDFARAYYELGANEDWEDYINERAEKVVTEKLIFYYIVRRENLIPAEADFDKLYQNAVDEYFNYYSEQFYKKELEAIKDETEKAKKLAEIKSEMLNYYGEEYFNEIVYYDYALEKIVDFAKFE